jgi:hypothetical protein
MFAGGQHGPGPFPPRKSIGQQLNNPNDYRWSMRALLVAMNRWITDGTEPPASRYPLVSDKTLVSLDNLRFPTLAGMQKPKEIHNAYRVFYGEAFAAKGIISLDPPEVNGQFPLLVPQVDRDGNELAGVRMPEVSVPLATYTGWNYFNAESGPTNLLSSMQGSYIPLARTRAERERTKDPRPSIEERYQGGRDQYVGLVSAAAKELVKGGYLLQDDVPAVVEHAVRHWDFVSSGSSSEATSTSRR